MMDSAYQQYYLDMLGIESWVLRHGNAPQDLSLGCLQALELKVKDCHLCSLSNTRKRVVFSRGNPNASIMLIGDAPDLDDDEQGLPFAGRAGRLLMAMLKGVGLREDDVYISNVVKCRPSNNTHPNVEEKNACTPYLKAQIQTVSPKLCIALGQDTGQFLLNTKDSLNDMRLKFANYCETPVFVTYHPAYLLLNPKDKKLAYIDLNRAVQWLKAQN